MLKPLALSPNRMQMSEIYLFWKLILIVCLISDTLITDIRYLIINWELLHFVYYYRMEAFIIRRVSSYFTAVNINNEEALAENAQHDV